MAGIGFELRKVFKNRTILNYLKGFSSSAVIASGPMLISILLIIIIDTFLINYDVPIADREIIKASIMYAYVFSFINTSGFVMIISRFIADKIFLKNTDDVLSSLLGVVSISILIGGIATLFFYSSSNISFMIKTFSYSLFIELSILYILMTYVSALKKYEKIVKSYLLGVITSICIIFYVFYKGQDIILGSILSIVVGYMVIILFLIICN
ncbi:exopolysaccharide Pel transporter PelG [Tissierella sp. Yu-01]|uniref:exopolysaccharide Pel transporter PelG n=1 Tax=Tissierella sp. Yu-01 TaxID=3035694 RepID=UPI00240E5AC6|nr:exopolysaccharide Pel transporter PelG [Tissierella sp. Yu-01]WFA10150.1 exopolysaccharide Pel transporter PelG [Tissierella sp. Yu-01]